MKDAIVLELARRWEAESATPTNQVMAEGNERVEDVALGCREAKRECADTLRTLVKMLGEV